MSTTTLPYPNFNWKCSDQLCAWHIFQAKAELWLVGGETNPVHKSRDGGRRSSSHSNSRKRSKLHAKPKLKCKRCGFEKNTTTHGSCPAMKSTFGFCNKLGHYELAKHTQKNKKAKGKGTHQSDSPKRVKPEKTKSKQSSLIPYTIITCINYLLNTLMIS